MKFMKVGIAGFLLSTFAFIGFLSCKNDTPVAISDENPAIFSATPLSGLAPLGVQFTHQCDGDITSFSWNFGDGGSSTDANPYHTYQNIGSYTVALTVGDLNSANTETKYNYITVLAPEQMELANTVWPKFGRDNRHTGLSNVEGPDVPSLNWSYAVGGKIWSSPVIGIDGAIYFGSDDYKLYALNPEGALKWFFQSNGEIQSTPAIDNFGVIYFGSKDNNLYALNPDGSLKWKYLTNGSVLSSPAIGNNGIIYVSSTDKNLYAINGDGALCWSCSLGEWSGSSPAIGVDGTIYLGSGDKKLYAINPNGSVKWDYETDNYTTPSSPAIAADGTVYFGSYDEHVYAMNPDGSLRWKYQTGGNIYCSPAIGADNTVYIGSADGAVYALSNNGQLKWKFNTGDEVDSSPLIDRNGCIYIGSGDGKFYAINSDGTMKWRYNTDSPFYFSAPAIDNVGNIYVGSDGAKLYAIGEGSSTITHNISQPNTPSGPASGNVGQSLFFSGGGAICSHGHSVEYRFDFGDGNYSVWSVNGVSHSYSSVGSYSVQCQARCSENHSIESSLSVKHSVVIANGTNTAPVALFSISYVDTIHVYGRGTENVEYVPFRNYTLNASDSYDPEDGTNNISFKWVVENINTDSPVTLHDTNWSTDPIFKFTEFAYTSLRVTLYVRDSSGLISSRISTI